MFQEPGALQAMYINSQTHAWRYWMDRPPLVARNLITLNVPGIDMEELQKEMDGEPKGGWYMAPFSEETLRSIAEMQIGGPNPDPRDAR